MKIITILTLVFMTAAVNADDSEALIKTALSKVTSANVKVVSILDTPIDGIKEVMVDAGRGSEILYISSDGKYIINGTLFDIDNRVDLTDQKKSVIRKDTLAKFDEAQRINFYPDNMEHHITVFTDIDCGYCRKLHIETVPELNVAGVEVRYLAFPRAGLDSASYRKIASAWCAKDKLAALTALKNRQPIKENVCKDNPVASHFLLGQKIGITGTPALILEDGALLPGYSPAAELLTIMGLDDNSDG